MKKLILLLPLSISLFGLTACQNQSNNSNSSRIFSGGVKHDKKLLKIAQQKDLDQAVKTYGKKNNLKFKKYDGKNDLKVKQDRLYPAAYKNDEFYLNNKKISIGWDPYGKYAYDYEVLAIYNANLAKDDHQTFLFCRHDKKPIVLIEQDNTRSHKIELKQSPDSGLNSAFVGIMNGFNK